MAGEMELMYRRAAKFAGVQSLTLHFPGNTSDGEEDTTRVYYIGLRGKAAPVSESHPLAPCERPCDTLVYHVSNLFP